MWLHSKRATIGVAVLALSGLLASCSTGAQSAGQSASSGNSSASAAYVAKAEAVAKQYLSATTTWHGPTSGPKPKPGMRIAIISCSQATTGCAEPAADAVQAAKLLGWVPKIFDGQGEPSVQLSEVETAVNSHYNAIILDLVSPGSVAAGLALAKANHVAVVSFGEPSPEVPNRSNWSWIPDVSINWLEQGIIVADYMIWKSNGNINALMLEDNSTPVVENGQFKGSYEVLSNKADCPNCKLTIKQFTVATLTSAPASEAAAVLQADPSINWLWCYDFCLQEAIGGIRSAGVGANLLGAGFDCNPENLHFMATGEVETVCSAEPDGWEAWGTIDEVNRLLNGDKPVAENPPIRLYDAAQAKQLTSAEIANGWQGGYNWQAEYEKIWGVG